jgi:excisionase family DNA binding protein
VGVSVTRFIMSKQPILPKFLTVEEVAELLRVEKRTVYEWVSRGLIPYRKAGNRTIFLLDEILDWTVPEAKKAS